MALDRYVAVPDDPNNKIIVEGPTEWDPDANPDVQWTPGTHPLRESEALATGYTYPGPPPAEINRQTIHARAAAALNANATFLAISGTPTNAQVLAQVRLLTRECNGLIRLLLNFMDTTDGT